MTIADAAVAHRNHSCSSSTPDHLCCPLRGPPPAQSAACALQGAPLAGLLGAGCWAPLGQAGAPPAAQHQAISDSWNHSGVAHSVFQLQAVQTDCPLSVVCGTSGQRVCAAREWQLQHAISCKQRAGQKALLQWPCIGKCRASIQGPTAAAADMSLSGVRAWSGTRCEVHAACL